MYTMSFKLLLVFSFVDPGFQREGVESEAALIFKILSKHHFANEMTSSHEKFLQRDS